MKYKWSHPGEWLAEKIQSAQSLDELRGMFNSVLPSLDSDTIQDIFQSEMASDGYFKPEGTDAKI